MAIDLSKVDPQIMLNYYPSAYTKEQLHLFVDAGYVTQEQYDNRLQEIEDAGNRALAAYPRECGKKVLYTYVTQHYITQEQYDQRVATAPVWTVESFAMMCYPDIYDKDDLENLVDHGQLTQEAVDKRIAEYAASIA